MRATTLSTIRSGPAELSDWYLLDDFPPILCRVVLSLQRFTLIQTEEGELLWISAELASMLLPTEPAEECLAERDEGTECETHCCVGFSRCERPVVSFTMDVTPAMADTIRGLYGIFNPHDLTDDPGTPPDLR